MMANAIRDVIDDRDYEMQDVLEDYLNYCYKDCLIPVSDSWKYLRMQLAGTTMDFNISNNIYYDKAERGFRLMIISAYISKKVYVLSGKYVLVSQLLKRKQELNIHLNSVS